MTRDNFEDILDLHDLFASMDTVIRRAMNAARERGYSEESIKSVLMVGGSSMIPSVQRTVQRIFGKDRVNLNRPLDAVARGGAAFVAGVDFFDHIQHDYAIQFVNREKGAYDYRTIVKRGTSYPSESPIAKMTIKASFDQQKQLGIAIYEMGEQRKRGDENHVELVFDPTGAARVVSVSSEEEQRRTHFWMNEHNPTFLLADPPAKQGEPRFGVEFNLDENKRLVITVKDLPTGRIINKDYPVVKLV
jgi:molecular chaperone DnaK (HSP70)